MTIELERAYDEERRRGTRVLVDRLWPRGVKKEAIELDEWRKDVAPSNELRKWFGHRPERWQEFRQRYFAELDAHESAWTPLVDPARSGDLVLVFAAKDREHNNAVALREFLVRRAADATLADYTDATSDDEALLAQLGELRDAAQSAQLDELADILGELATRVEMLQMTICAAERRGAISELITDFEQRLHD